MRHAGAVPHPIPYQGSKRALASEILSHAPSSFARLVEPFAGSAAISLAASRQKRTNQFWLNDAHPPLVDLWREIIDHPNRISDRYRVLWEDQRGIEREFFDRVRGEFNRSHKPEHFLYLLARCVKAAIRYNSNGEFNNTPDNRRQGAKPQEMTCRIQGASELLKGRTNLTCLDYRDVLLQCGSGDLIYMDPPYQGVCQARDNRYAPKVNHQEFHEALDQLNRRDAMYIVSYDGRTGQKSYGEPLPKRLKLKHLELCAGRSTQATLLGHDHVTYESLYLSAALVEALRPIESVPRNRAARRQLTLAFGDRSAGIRVAPERRRSTGSRIARLRQSLP